MIAFSQTSTTEETDMSWDRESTEEYDDGFTRESFERADEDQPEEEEQS